MTVSTATPSGWRLLFVCQGNICRSPMAAGLASQMLPAGSYVDSAGLNPFGDGATPEAIEVMARTAGIDISGHYPKPVSQLDLLQFDYIIAIDPQIFAFLKRYCPLASARLIRWNIADPYLGGISAYARCFQEIKSHLEKFRAWLTEQSGP